MQLGHITPLTVRSFRMDQLTELDEKGFCILSRIFSADQIASLLLRIESAIQKGSDGSIKNSKGETYAARNLAEIDPDLLTAWRNDQLVRFLTNVLGKEFGIVRILYFDKHPNRTWSLPWHKDMTIAVKDNSHTSDKFSKPTCKSGIDHVEASTEQLQQMVTLRIHLDEVTSENGPLEVAIGSHKNGKQASSENDVEKILVDAGDVLAMRPLISHASGSSAPGTIRHRRILHLEFAANPKLPDGFEWYRFETVAKV